MTEAGWSARKFMDQQEKADDPIIKEKAKPFKVADAESPDLIVEPQESPVSASAVVVTVPAPPATPAVPVKPSAAPVAKTSHPASISNLVKANSKPPPKKNEQPKAKSPMTPRRFINFVAGLFVAGMAGSFSNTIISASIERAFPPQYVKDFNFARSLPDTEQRFGGMSAALKKGGELEFSSRRFANLTSALAHDLDNDGRYLIAKTEWAKAAYPSDSAPPDLRERKRSYITDEARSEHMAFVSGQTLGVDQDVLQEVEDSANIFQKSEVLYHGHRAFEAFLAAGELAADSKNYVRARKDFDQAEVLANATWMDGGYPEQSLTAARWRANLHELIQSLPLYAQPTTHALYAPAALSLNDREALDKILATKDFAKADAVFSAATKAHQENSPGETIVSEMYAYIGAHNDDHEKNRQRRNTLYQWGKLGNSAKGWLGLAYWYNEGADLRVKSYIRGDEKNARFAFEQLHTAIEDLHQALALDPRLASDPAFIKAIQTNLQVGMRLTNPQPDVSTELNATVKQMKGNEAQLFLDGFIFNLNHEEQSADLVTGYVKQAEELAKKIGGVAGDEFYARVIDKVELKPPGAGNDAARYFRGAASLAKKFAPLKTQTP